MTLLPQSIAPRLIAFILAAITLSQSFSLWDALMTGHRAHAGVAHSQIFEQVEATLRLLNTLPAPSWDDTVDHLSLANLCYSLTPQPIVTPDRAEARTERLTERLHNLLGRHSAGEPRLRLLDQPDDRCVPYRAVSGRPSVGQPDHHHHDMGGLLISVPLSDGRWLNADARMVIPGVWETIPILSLFSMAVATVVAVLGVVGYETRDLRRLAAAVEQLGRGQTVPRLAEAGPRDVASLIRAFNTMQDRLTRFIQDRTRLLAAISHDLRTPLTSLRLRAELLDDGEAAEQIIATVDEMAIIVRSTLEFASSDAVVEPSRVVELTSLVDSLVQDMAAIGMDVHFEESPRINMECRPIAIRRAVRNLVENAVRYGERAQLRCRRVDAVALIEIDDNGPGIPEDRLTEVVKPFTRLENSRNAGTGGIGLGLAIASDIVAAHGGTLDLTNTPSGLRASLRLPLPHG